VIQIDPLPKFASPSHRLGELVASRGRGQPNSIKKKGGKAGFSRSTWAETSDLSSKQSRCSQR